jgi:type IV pilus assembly protein PilN
MIRINLLPVRKTQKTKSVQQQLLVGLGIVITAIIASIVWTAAVSSTAEAKRQKVAEKSQELKQLDKIIGEVNEFTAKKEELEEKLKVIEDLRKSKTGPVKALDDLATEIPNRVWLTMISEKAGSVTIEGSAIDPEDVSAFMKSLQKSRYFSGVVLAFSKAKRKGEITLYDFKITARVDYSA